MISYIRKPLVYCHYMVSNALKYIQQTVLIMYRAIFSWLFYANWCCLYLRSSKPRKLKNPIIMWSWQEHDLTLIGGRLQQIKIFLSFIVFVQTASIINLKSFYKMVIKLQRHIFYKALIEVLLFNIEVTYDYYDNQLS